MIIFKIMKLLLFILILFPDISFSNSMDTIYSKVINEKDERYETSIYRYKKSDTWKIWSVSIGSINYSKSFNFFKDSSNTLKNMEDLNLNTVWVIKNPIGQKFSFSLNINKASCFGCPYTFYGVINMFNGYCKTETIWGNYSRVKTLKVYFNDKPVCILELSDTWQFQTIDISKYFINTYLGKNNKDAINVINGDKLTFQIVDIYKGNKFLSVAISEFMGQGASN